MKHSIEYTRFQGFFTPNFDGPEKLKYFEMSLIWSPIILFSVLKIIDIHFSQRMRNLNTHLISIKLK